MKRPGAGDADPVAGLAEVMGHRRDEAEPAAGFRHVGIARRAARAVGKVGEGVAGREAGADQRQRQILIDPARADVAHRHDLDQGEIHALAVCPFHERGDFVLV